MSKVDDEAMARHRYIERLRFRAYIEMTSNGATSEEALVYLDLVYPFPHHQGAKIHEEVTA